MVWYGMAWLGWHGMLWYDMAWHGRVLLAW